MSIHPELLETLLDLDLTPHLGYGRPEATLKQRAADSLRNSAFKKYCPTGKSVVQDRAALSLFLEMNSHCEQFKFTPDQHTDAVYMALTYARDFIASLMTSELDYPLNISERGRFGPGASIGCEGDDFVTKSSNSPLSCTDPLLYDLYMASITRSRTDLQVEHLRRSSFGRYDVVSGSHTSCVPKNAKISRTICTEPLLNMFLQQGIGSYLTERLRKGLGIDLTRQQSVNQELARQGSLSGEFSTIDLSSASDTISVQLCRWLLPSNLYTWLDVARSPSTRVEGNWRELHMISSMGNAFTFPLQTMIFSALVYGAYKVLDMPFTLPGSAQRSWSVFGDDIIVAGNSFEFVCQLLRVCGFFPNKDKSFATGLFRESCGADYYNGTNIRGVYIYSLEDQHDRYSAINRLSMWSARWNIPLVRVLSYLTKRVKYRPIPPYEDPSFGVYAPSTLVRETTKVLPPKRRNFPLEGTLPETRVRYYAYEVLAVAPRRYRLDDDSPNGFVVFQAALQGALRGGHVGLRSRVRKPRKVKKQSVGWDCYLHGRTLLLESEGQLRWKHLMENVLWTYSTAYLAGD